MLKRNPEAAKPVPARLGTNADACADSVKDGASADIATLLHERDAGARVHLQAH